MKLTCSIVLAVIAVAFAAPQYGQLKNDKLSQSKKTHITTTLAADVHAEFDCSDKEDRGYVIGCNQDYFLCWKGTMTKASCPEGMMYNQENGQCDFNINIFECTGVRTTTPLADEPSTLKSIDFDCSKLSDGDYAFSHDCQLNYVSCVGGQGIERMCPDNLQFDPENRVCERLENIEVCGGAATTVAPEVKVEFDCPSPSGSFALTSQLCSAVYYLCNDNVASIAICDEPMIWDDAHKSCALPKDIPECAFDCSGKADAAYSAGCSNNYWWCWQERSTKLACPEGMVFDSERSLCDIEDNVFECSGVRTTTPLADEPSTMKPVDFKCTGLEDGHYAFKHGEMCQPKFVSCVGGLAWEMSCPEGLVFDSEQNLCERIENIVACGGTAEPIVEEMTTKAARNSYGQSKPVHKTTKAPVKTTTIAADVPKDNYDSYEQETTTLADEPITTTRRSSGYGQRRTTLADIPVTTTKSSGYGQRKATTLADMPSTTRSSGYGQRRTTTLADIPTTRASYGQRRTTTLADEPITTTRRASYNQRRTTTVAADLPKDDYEQELTTLADEEFITTLGYNADGYGAKIELAEPTTRRHHKMTTTTLAADVPSDDSYGNYEETTTLADIPTTTRSSGYGKRRTTTIADVPTTRASYGQRRTTTLADIPSTTRRSGYGQRKTTTLADIPTTKAYGSYNKKTTTLADLPTTKAYGGYNKKTTTLADIPTTQAYGSYKKQTTTLADIPSTTRRSGYGQRKTTTLADIPTTQAYGSYNKKTTTLADLPSTTRRSGYGQRKTTTLADIPTTQAYGSYKKQTTTLADIPVTEEDNYEVETTTLADLPTTTRRQRYSKVVADEPRKPIKQGY